VTLTGAAFTAPEVTVDTPLTFSLVVNDGTVSSPADEVTVLVRQVNRAPTADAGPGTTVDERSTVTLSGSGSDPDGDAVSFLWRQVSGPAVVLAAPTTADLSFVAPEVTADATVVLELVTSDGALSSAPSRVTVAVRQVNRRPTVRAVASAAVAEGTLVPLTGLGTDPDGDSLTWSWVQTAGPTVALSGATTPAPTFSAPAVAADEVLRFRVVVSDGQLDSEPADVSVRVVNDNRPPVADPGVAQEAASGALVHLDGSKSSDPEGTPLRFSWVQVDGVRVALDGAATATPTFTAPAVTADTALLFRLTVQDAEGLAANATVKVTVKAVPAQGCGCTGGGEGVGAWVCLLGLLVLVRRRATT
jgi:uncharacterized protein (TIGR03382 family)